jgi:biopolymer transport protein ExbD
MKRMARNRKKATPLNLTSLMDVFTILVFFLLVNSASTEVLETPKQITLPASTIEDKPRETVVIFISPSEITVQGESVVTMADLAASEDPHIAQIGERLDQVNDSVIGLNTQKVAERQEVTILSDKSVPFSVVRRVMSTCTRHGFERISLAVLQKAPQQLANNG